MDGLRAVATHTGPRQLAPHLRQHEDRLLADRGTYLRSNFSGSRLVRLLNTWAPMDVDASRPDFAARLGQWVGVPDAITLHATHQAVRPSKWPRPQLARCVHAPALAAEFQRVRTALAQAIKTHDGGGRGPDDGSAKAASGPVCGLT